MGTSEQGRWLQLLQEVAEHLTASESVEEIGETVVTLVRGAVGATAATLTVLTPDATGLVLVGSAGMSEETDRLARAPIPLEASPASLALERAEAVVFESLADRDRAFPQWAGWPSNHEAWLILPMIARGRQVGAVSFGWNGARTFSDDEVAFAMAVAHQTAVAVDRARALDAERRQRQVLELLSEGARLMISSLNPGVVVERLTQIAVPRLADWCGVYLAEGDVLVPAAITVRGPDGTPLVLPPSSPVPLDGASGLARCFRTGAAVAVGNIADAPAMASGPLTADALRAMPIRSGVAVPIVAADLRIGVLMLGFEEDRAYDDELRFAAEGLAARAGIALSNAQRFQDQRRVAHSLTQALVPNTLPAMAGFAAAARYLPAGDPVAGDWHDVLELEGGSYLLGIGDVAGHGMTAAAHMAELRNAARGIAVAAPDPATIMRVLAALGSGRDDLFATAIYGILRPDGVLRWTAAGHLPLITFDPAGARLHPTSPIPPLGCTHTAPPVVTEWELPEGGGVVLLTDGVVERRRGPGLLDSLQAVVALVGGMTHQTPEKIADAIVDSFCRSAEDDCCILVVKRD